MKICLKCKIEKSLDDFHNSSRNSDGKQPYCKPCKKNWSYNHFRNNKEYRESIRRRQDEKKDHQMSIVINHLKDHPCIDCGEKELVVLEFHHLVPEDKEFNISAIVSRGLSDDILLKEIDKCVVLCANCHKRRTAQKQGWRKYLHYSSSG